MKNQLFYGDNLENFRKFIKDESVDLCYIDPPFNSKRNYNQIYNNLGKEDKAQAQAFVDTWVWNKRANDDFEEIKANKNQVFTRQSMKLMEGLKAVLGESPLMAYLLSMTQRIAEIYRVLKATGSFYLHCDPTSSHYLKLVCDSIFCGRGGEFQNEIIWSYQRWTGATTHFQSMHDIVFFYTKEKKGFTFNIQLEPYSDKSQHKAKRFSKAEKGKVISQEYTDDISRQKAMRDVWEISSLNSQAKERLGYPTQKPEALLERIIKASSNEGDVVLDCYCGCGTSIAVAERLKRNWIGIDITYQSISLILKRLEDSFGKEILENINLLGVPKDMESAIALAHKKDDRLRKEFEKWAVLSFSNNRAMINEKKGGDKGIDGTAYMVDFDEEGKQIAPEIIFSVKSNKTLSPNVIRELFGTMQRENAAVGYLLTLYPMPNLVKEAHNYGSYENKMFTQTYPKIEVISVGELLKGRRMNLPTVSVLKSAERKIINGNEKLF